MENLKTADQRTRQRVLESAVVLLAERGLSGELLKDAVNLAQTSLERARIFFQRDEDLVLALYARLAAQLEARVAELPDTDLADRFRAIMLAKLALVAPYRLALGALLASLLDPRHELGALSPQTEVIRNRVMGVFSAVVLGARDRRKLEADSLTRSLYGLHLGLMLLWTQDQSPGSQATRAGIDFIGDLLALSGRLSWLPNFKSSFARLDDIAAPLIEPEPDPSVNELSIAILRQLFRNRRLQTEAGECVGNPCAQCLALHLPKVHRFVRDRFISCYLRSPPSRQIRKRFWDDCPTWRKNSRSIFCSRFARRLPASIRPARESRSVPMVVCSAIWLACQTRTSAIMDEKTFSLPTRDSGPYNHASRDGALV